MENPRQWSELEALELVKTRFQAIFDAASDAILVIDQDSRVLHANAAVEAIFGHEPAKLRGRSMAELMPVALRESHHAGLRRFVETGERRIPWRGVRLTGLHADGHEVPIEVSFGSFEEAGRLYFAGVVRHVAARVAEERRREVELEVSRVLAKSDAWRPAVEKVLEVTCGALEWQVAEFWRLEGDELALDASHLADEAFRPLVAGSSRFARGAGLPGRVWEAGASIWSQDLTADPAFRRSQLATRLGLATGLGFPVILEDQLFGVITMFTTRGLEPDRDLRETVERIGTELGLFGRRREAERERDAMLDEARAARRRAEAEAEAKQRMLEVVSHDLRNMLQAFALHLELVSELAGGEARPHAAHLVKVLRDMTRLVQDLEDLSGLESGRIRLERSAVEPAALVSSVCDLVRPLAAGLELAIEIEGDLPPVEGDEARLRRVLLNLAHNAIKFTPEGGRVVLGAGSNDDGVVFFVSDTGAGIPCECQGEVFNPFWQGDERSAGGSGLGLSIARGFVDLHGGSISLDSEVGRGTTVRFEIPAAGAGD